MADEQPVVPETPETPPSPETPETPPTPEVPDKPVEPQVRMVTEEVEEDKDDKKKQEDPELDPTDKDVISKLVSKQIDPFTKQLEKQTNMIEANSFVASNPDFAKYKDSILKHMEHPAYKNIPVDRIARMVAGDDLIKIGAAREREAAAKAAETKSGGNTARMTPTGKDWHNASTEDYQAQRTTVLGQGR